VSVIGHKVFKKSRNAEFYITHRGKKQLRKDEGFVVLVGSHINQNIADSLSSGYKYLITKYESRINNDKKMKESISFSSLSVAATFVFGRNANGFAGWKTAEGKALKDVGIYDFFSLL
jgi:hypothetical protein